MSGGVSLPRFSITVPQRAGVSVAAQGRPVVASVTVRGQQGVQGERGDPGPPGTDLGFGYIRYGEAANAAAHSLTANQRTPFSLMPDPSGSVDTLRPPFTGFDYWDGALLRTRALNDVFQMKIRMMVTSSVAGGNLLMELVQAGAGNGTLVDSDRKVLSSQADAQETIVFAFTLFTGQAFTTNSGQLFVTSSVDVEIKNEVLAIAPINAGS